MEAQGRQTSMHLLSSLEKHLHACNQACVEAGKKGEHVHPCAEADKMKGLLVAIRNIATAVPWIPTVEPRCILELVSGSTAVLQYYSITTTAAGSNHSFARMLARGGMGGHSGWSVTHSLPRDSPADRAIGQ